MRVRRRHRRRDGCLPAGARLRYTCTCMHAAATHTHTHTRRATCPPPDLPAAAANASLPRKRRAIRVSTLLIVTLVVLAGGRLVPGGRVDLRRQRLLTQGGYVSSSNHGPNPDPSPSPSSNPNPNPNPDPNPHPNPNPKQPTTPSRFLRELPAEMLCSEMAYDEPRA